LTTGRYKFQHEPLFYAHVAGRQAVLEGDGRTFDEVAQERLKEAA
jgi:hypothetical protein